MSRTTGREDRADPAEMADLEPVERFIVWCFRRWVIGAHDRSTDHWGMVWNELAGGLGAADGREALTQFSGMIRALQEHARKTIHHHGPCCPCLGPDELRFIRLIAACQHRRPGEARALAEWMILPDGATALLQAATRLGQILRAHDVMLPDRYVPGRHVVGVVPGGGLRAVGDPRRARAVAEFAAQPAPGARIVLH
ncbi:hypothetical protein [Oceanibacterium hippocampi]|uniref:Uncharacterized protein n=1 Tax=Oceanibacterium hippocampi TaxID=745714 RepID=A0A1Y5S193_9PROT|nr:hypothetical protein [Oceanibacterium hippocampi]SLN30339.1 hypothetical protein OCH7691_01052 [Oceanibacterium hippocampi]